MSAAARALRVAQPTVSRRLRELEDALGFALFERAHGGTALTARGERLLEPARKMAEWAAELARAAEQKQAKPSGLVRVTAPPGIAFDFLAPFAGWLRTEQPELRLEVLSVEYLDLTRGAAGSRNTRMRAPQRDLVVINSAEQSVAALASKKAYAARLPKKPSLSDVDWVGWAPPFEKLQPTAQMAEAIPGFVPSFSADDFLVQLAAAQAGAGDGLGTLQHRFRSSALVRLDLAFARFPKSMLYLVAAKSALAIPRIRAVADLLGDELRRSR